MAAAVAGTSGSRDRALGFEAAVEQLLGILGGDASQLEARQLLHSTGGDLQAALNLHCDGPAQHPGRRPEKSCLRLPTASWGRLACLAANAGHAFWRDDTW